MRYLYVLVVVFFALHTFAQSPASPFGAQPFVANIHYAHIPIKAEPNVKAARLATITNDSCLFISYDGGDFVKVKYKDHTGFVYKMFFRYDRRAVSVINAYNESSGSTDRLHYMQFAANAKGSRPSSTSRKARSSRLDTVPKGDEFYLNSDADPAAKKKKGKRKSF